MYLLVYLESLCSEVGSADLDVDLWLSMKLNFTMLFFWIYSYMSKDLLAFSIDYCSGYHNLECWYNKIVSDLVIGIYHTEVNIIFAFRFELFIE